MSWRELLPPEGARLPRKPAVSAGSSPLAGQGCPAGQLLPLIYRREGLILRTQFRSHWRGKKTTIMTVIISFSFCMLFCFVGFFNGTLHLEIQIDDTKKQSPLFLT